MTNTAKLSFVTLVLGAFLACPGPGDHSNNDASKLTYTNPTQGEYRLEAVGGSDTGTVTLVLRGPSYVMARGANFGLDMDTAKAGYVKQGADYAGQGTVFDLGADPKIFSAVLDAGNLRVSMAQKGSSVSAKSLGGDIATVQVQLQPGAQRGPVQLKALPAKVLLDNGTEQTIQVSVGTLEAQ